MKLEEAIQQEKFKTPYHKLGVNISFSHYWFVDKFKQQLSPYNVSMQQYNILRILRGQGDRPATINLLKERMIDKSSDASRLVERLRIKGLVERVTCPNDRRSVDIVITPKGLDLLKKVGFKEDEFFGLFGKLSIEEVNTLNCLLDKLRD